MQDEIIHKYGKIIMSDVTKIKLNKRLSKPKNQYDKFLHKIQQQKMKELWGNKEDDIWEKV